MRLNKCEISDKEWAECTGAWRFSVPIPTKGVTQQWRFGVPLPTRWLTRHRVDFDLYRRVVRARRTERLRADIRSIANSLGGIGFSA